MRIEQQRLGERLQLDWQLGDMSEHSQVPPLSLQPLIENAIYHGIEATTAGGTVVIRAQYKDNALHIEVENPRQASHLSSSEANFKTHNSKTHNGIAIDNIRARIAAIYHGVGSDSHHQATAQLRLSKTSQAFIAILILPINLPARASTVDGEQ